MEHRNDYMLDILIFALIIALFGLYLEIMQPDYSLTGNVAQPTNSQLILEGYIAISLSSNLTYGINFGNVTNLPSFYINASANYANESRTQTQYFVNISSDSNVNADICVKSTRLNTSAGNEIGLANYTWSDSKSNNVTDPWPAPGNHTMSESYITGMRGIAPSNSAYYRFWLNVSAATAPGVYNNTVYFQAVTAGNPCA
jgi:hypothetical protein